MRAGTPGERGGGVPGGAEFGTRAGRGKEEEGASGGSPHVTSACGEEAAARAPRSNQLARGGAWRACAAAPPPPGVTCARARRGGPGARARRRGRHVVSEPRAGTAAGGGGRGRAAEEGGKSREVARPPRERAGCGMAAALGALGNGTGPGAGPGPAAPPAGERARGSGRGARPGERQWLRAAAASSSSPRPGPAPPHLTSPRGRPPFPPRLGLSPSRPRPGPASRGCPAEPRGAVPGSRRCPGREALAAAGPCSHAGLPGPSPAPLLPLLRHPSAACPWDSGADV